MGKTKTVNLYGFSGLPPGADVKKWVEAYTGPDSVFALEVKMSKKGPRSYANVQFERADSVDKILDLCNSRSVLYNGAYLKAREHDSHVSLPRTYVCQLSGITLYFGCKTAEERFYTLWPERDVSMNFSNGMKKIDIFLAESSAQYRLQLASEQILNMRLFQPRYLSVKYLVIQLYATPRIYKKRVNSIYTFCKGYFEDQWERTTDYTPNNCIGQSSSILLALPTGVPLPDFRDSFVYFKETEKELNVVHGHPPAHSKNLVPILPAQPGIDFNVHFRLCSLVQGGYLPWPLLNSNVYKLLETSLGTTGRIEYALQRMRSVRECCYDPVTWLTREYQQYSNLKRPMKSTTITLDDGLVWVRRVLVTPSKVYFCGPEVNQSNRVLRNFIQDIDNFMRVSFVDEEWGPIHAVDLSRRAVTTTKTSIYGRILSTLKDGIEIDAKKFEFLAFSSSQLRENSCWMFAARPGLTAADIREWMGDFTTIRNVAKYAARLGQSFGTSRETLNVPNNETEIIPDIMTLGTEYNFSDGIGKISLDFARKVAVKCGYETTPSAFQIRYGGFKGVVAVDPRSTKKLSLRKSMSKFDSPNTSLDVLAVSQYQPCYLNRQIIVLISTLGIRDEVFQKKQRETVAELDAILTDSTKAYDNLSSMAPGEITETLKAMLSCGYKPNVEPFLRMMLENFRATKLQDLRTKARIFIPKARSMMGCLDETGTLEYGQVFVQFSSPARSQFLEGSRSPVPNNVLRIIQGNVLVAKNPCLHPGDVRVLKAVNVPALHHMKDCVVFPQKGHRPHPNECSGSDLDGDIYFVCWDPDLIPISSKSPMDYTAAANQQLDHPVTIEEVQQYFADYMVNDSLGVIANAHVVFADKEPSRAMSDKCVRLAKLFSIAVDFPKTGVPAEIPVDLRVKEYPDFMEKGDKTTYESHRVLGQLFREVRTKTPTSKDMTSFTAEIATRTYDSQLEVEGFEDYVDEAFHYKDEYDFRLGNLMDHYGIKTEAEILSGGVLKMSKYFDRRRDSDAVAVAVRALRKETKSWFEKDKEFEDQLAKASAWYHVTYHRRYFGTYNVGLKRPHFISFPWCIHAKLIEIKRNSLSKAHPGLKRVRRQ